MTDRLPGFSTLAVHAGAQPDPTTGARVTPIYQTTSFVFNDADHAASLFGLQAFGNIYTRIGNPTNAVLEERVAALEGGTAALAVASGHAAQVVVLQQLLRPGDEFIAARKLYGGSINQFNHAFKSFGWNVVWADPDDIESFERAVSPHTKAIFIESIANPGGSVTDIEAVSAVARKAGVPLIVDNTLATPYLIRPIDHGADIVVHSLTKFLGGHGTTLGGAIVDSGRFPWREHAARFPKFNEPDASYHGLIYTERFGNAAYIARCRSVFQRTTGAVLAPLSAFLLLQGIETVALRLERHVENGRRVAEFLCADPRVAWVNYAGFADNPYYALAQKYLDGRAASLLTFGIVGGLEAGKAFYDALKLFKRLVNMGDAKSLACHPASTTHRQMSAEQQRMAGVLPETIRLSIGIEHSADIIEDIDQALDKACPSRLQAAE